MKTLYRKGVIRAHNRIASISFNPGWGEPGEWNLAFVDETGKSDGYCTLDAADSFSSQQEYWHFMSYGREHYPEKFVNFDWAAKVGNYEDAIRIGLEYTGYDDDSLAHDLDLQTRTLNELKKQAVEALRHIPIVASEFETFAAKTEELSQFIAQIREQWSVLEAHMAVYRAIRAGKPVGCGWTAETL